MNFLVIGQGGREHALIKALYTSPSVKEIHAVPGNDGFQKMAICHNLDWHNTQELLQLCLNLNIEVVLIGPEDPLVAGLADLLRDRGILVVGPNREAAQLEGSKIFAKKFMLEAKVPTADYRIVSSTSETLKAMSDFSKPYILKADGLCAGKGVFICQTPEELEQAATQLFETKIFGEAGSKALFEEALTGWEMSLLVLTNGTDYEMLPVAMDHKRLKDQNQGPNTGGMGTIAPMPIEKSLMDEIEATIVFPTVQSLKRKNYIYRGVIFFGLMITKSGPKVLEYNVRLGDPETQVILPLLDIDFGFLFQSLAQGQLPAIPVKTYSSCCVVLCAEGYPENPVKNTRIEGDVFFETSTSYFLHAGTRLINDSWTVQGGRVINSIGLGVDFKSAITAAYTQAEKITWNGLQKRNDIGSHLPAPAHPHGA